MASTPGWGPGPVRGWRCQSTGRCQSAGTLPWLSFSEPRERGAMLLAHFPCPCYYYMAHGTRHTCLGPVYMCIMHTWHQFIRFRFRFRFRP